MALVAVIVGLTTAGTAWAAFQGLPASGSQVNDDPGSGIDKTRSVSGEDPTNADVIGGALAAGGPAVPWAIFRQQTSGHDQVFVRAFAGGAWSTKGIGTVAGKSSVSPTFPGSLNFDQAQDAEAPAIDFAGTGRTVPWATWYEATGAFTGSNQIFASRFDNTGGANQGKWLFAGQSRGNGTGTVPVPSLNIHTNQDAENPSVAGGSTADPTKPGPWVTWQETDAAAAGKDQIFVEKPLGPGSTNCAGVKPAAADPTAAPIGGFCWQQVGVERIAAADPSLNVDTTRDGVEPDIAFTGPNDSVPWVVWYEQGATGVAGLHSNELVFAAKGVAPSTATPPTGTVDGGFNWITVGSAGQGILDNSAGGGPCAANGTIEGQCSQNSNASADAEDPRVAAGTMNPANPTVPWIAWDEMVGGVHQIFVSRLVGGTHFELANGGAPISVGTNDATRPDITFSGNTPYVTWRSQVAGNQVAFTGHFVNATSPTFVLDSSNVPLTPTGQADVREPISSSCIATPFNADGAACQGGAIGTPFFLYTNGTAPAALFAQAYDVDTPTTGLATGLSTTTATLTGTVNPEGGPARVSFQFGTTTTYGQTTAASAIAPTNTVVSFQAPLTGPPTIDHAPLPGGRDHRLRRQAGPRPDPDDRVRPPAATPSEPTPSHRRSS